jgi:hypothetical protein
MVTLSFGGVVESKRVVCGDASSAEVGTQLMIGESVGDGSVWVRM